MLNMVSWHASSIATFFYCVTETRKLQSSSSGSLTIKCTCVTDRQKSGRGLLSAILGFLPASRILEMWGSPVTVIPASWSLLPNS